MRTTMLPQAWAAGLRADIRARLDSLAAELAARAPPPDSPPAGADPAAAAAAGGGGQALRRLAPVAANLFALGWLVEGGDL